MSYNFFSLQTFSFIYVKDAAINLMEKKDFFDSFFIEKKNKK